MTHHREPSSSSKTSAIGITHERNGEDLIHDRRIVSHLADRQDLPQHITRRGVIPRESVRQEEESLDRRVRFYDSEAPR